MEDIRIRCDKCGDFLDSEGSSSLCGDRYRKLQRLEEKIKKIYELVENWSNKIDVLEAEEYFHPSEHPSRRACIGQLKRDYENLRDILQPREEEKEE